MKLQLVQNLLDNITAFDAVMDGAPEEALNMRNSAVELLLDESADNPPVAWMLSQSGFNAALVRRSVRKVPLSVRPAHKGIHAYGHESITGRPCESGPGSPEKGVNP